MAVLTDVLGLRFLAPLAVTSASEVTSCASVEVHFVVLEGSARRIWFHILDKSSFQSPQFNSTRESRRCAVETPPFTSLNLYTLPEWSRCCTKAVIEATSASDQSELVLFRPIWLHQGPFNQQEN